MEIKEMKEILADTDYELTLTSSDTPWHVLARRVQSIVDELQSRAQANSFRGHSYSESWNKQVPASRD